MITLRSFAVLFAGLLTVSVVGVTFGAGPSGSVTQKFAVNVSAQRANPTSEALSVNFSIAPGFTQSLRFRAGVVALVGAALYLLYLLRMSRLAAELDIRFAERIAERTRIAQNIHDTLLQGFISGAMHLQLLKSELAAHETQPRLARIIQQMTTAIEEGRRAVIVMRQAPDDIEAALLLDAECFRLDQETKIQFVVSGTARRLRPAAKDTIYHIAREALANAFRHGSARCVEVSVQYANDGLTVIVRDDGHGMDPDQVSPGHWGLRDMRDRAEMLEAQFTILSKTNAGTEVRLVVPPAVAFGADAKRRWWSWVHSTISPDSIS